MRTFASLSPLLLCLTACGGPGTMTFLSTVCQEEHRSPLQPDEPGSNGLTGQQVLDLAVERFREVHVSWDGDVDPVEDTFAFSFGAPTAYHDVDRPGDHPSCQARAWVEVEVPVAITSGSGWVAGSGVARLVALDADLVLMSWADADGVVATIEGPYLDTILDRVDGVTRIYIHLGAFGTTYQSDEEARQSIGIGAQFDNDLGSGGSSVFSCNGECFRPADDAS